MDTREAQGALRLYTGSLLAKALPRGTLSEQCVQLLGTPGFILSDTPQCGLARGVLLCYELFSPHDWERAFPAGAALDFTNCAIELLDKALDSESLGAETESLTVPQQLNMASCLQSLAHCAIDDLERRGFPAEKILECHRAIAGIVVETSAAQAKDLLAEGHWLGFEEALPLAMGKGAPLASGMGALGAYLASNEPELIDACVKFCRDVGTYSQVVNDLNDAMPGAVHKSDVRKRKSTLPLVYFVNSASADHAQARSLLRSDTTLSSEQEALIRRALEESGALDFTAAIAETFRLKARKALGPLELGHDISPLLRAFLAWP